MKVPVLCVVMARTVVGVEVAAGILPAGSVHKRFDVEEIETCDTPPHHGMALIQVKSPTGGVRPITKKNRALIVAAHLEEKLARFGKSKATHSRGSSELSPVKPTLKDDIIHILGIARDDPCHATGENAGVGCAVGCKCGLWKRCYPKTMLMVHPGKRGNSTDQEVTSQIQVGFCDLAPPVLVLLSVFLLLGATFFFALVRFVAMLPGHYGLEPKHREVHKPQRSQVEEPARTSPRQGWRDGRPPAQSLRRFHLQVPQQQPEQQPDEGEHDATDRGRKMGLQKDGEKRLQPASSGASSTESPCPQAAG